MTLSQMIDEKLIKEQETRKDRIRSGKYNPSYFGRCYRLQVFNRANVPQSNPADILGLRKFAVGKLFHTFVQNLLPEHRNEVLVETEDILGYADIVIDSEQTVWDIKSQHSKSFWYMEKSQDIEKDKETNILQVMAYVYLLNFQWGKLCFISKDDLCIAQYAFHIDKWKARVEKEIEALRYWWDVYKNEDSLPPAEPRAYNGKDCEYCNWKDHCFKLQGKPIKTEGKKK